MDFYKKIFRSKKARFKILSFLKFVPDKQMISLQYYVKHHRILHLTEPKRYTEKMQWYKLYYRDPQMKICVDKYRVREYVENKGLGHILNELYAVFESPEEIDLEKLPNRFVLKTNNGSGTNVFCKNKNECSLESVKAEFRDFMIQTEASAGREWVYSGITPVIIAEQYLEDSSQTDQSIIDYKIFCFNGVPEYILCVANRFTNYRYNFYDIQWNNLHVESGHPCCDSEIPRPINLEEMLDIARTLSEDFPAVRVDLYSIQGKVYFGEMTFFSWSGYVDFKPDSFDYELGNKFVLPERNN